MPLKMKLDPQEWMMVGDTKVTNVHFGRASFVVDGRGPVLRQAHTLDETSAQSLAERAYLAVQRLYLGVSASQDEYSAAAERLIGEDPSVAAMVEKANGQIGKGALYSALRTYRTLLGNMPS